MKKIEWVASTHIQCQLIFVKSAKTEIYSKCDIGPADWYVVHSCNPSTQEAEERETRVLRPTWAT